MSCGVGHGHSLDPMWLWLWCRPGAAALIQPLGQEPPYAARAALKKQTNKQTKKVTGVPIVAQWVKGLMLSL